MAIGKRAAVSPMTGKAFFGTWKRALLDPKGTFASEKRETSSSMEKGVMNLGAGFAILAALYVFLAIIGRAPSPYLLALWPLLVLLFDVLTWFMARALGGNGSFAQHFNVSSLFLAPLLVLGVIPWLNAVFSLYCVYLSFVLMSSIHGLKPARAWPAIAVAVLAVCAVSAAAFLSVGAIVPFNAP